MDCSNYMNNLFDIKREVIRYNNSVLTLNVIFEYYKLFISIHDRIRSVVKYNYIFFTFNDVKYYTRLSNRLFERRVFGHILADLNCIHGIKDICYEEGQEV